MKKSLCLIAPFVAIGLSSQFDRMEITEFTGEVVVLREYLIHYIRRHAEDVEIVEPEIMHYKIKRKKCR